LTIDKIENLAENTMVGLYLFGGGEALGRVLVLSNIIEFLHRRRHVSVESLDHLPYLCTYTYARHVSLISQV
jgi:hypothetical protein